MISTQQIAIIEGDKPMNTYRQTAVIKENNMKPTAANLIRWAGLSAMVAGSIFVAIQPIHPPDVLASVHTSAFIIITAFKTAMSVFGLFGMTGLYARQVEESGWLGLTGYLLLTIFYALQMCFSFVEPLILPLLTTEAPKFVESVLGMASGAGGPLNLGALAAVYMFVAALYMLGCLLFGIATFRARILPRGQPACWPYRGPCRSSWSHCFRTRSIGWRRCRWGSLWPGWVMRSGRNGASKPRNPSVAWEPPNSAKPQPSSSLETVWSRQAAL